MKDLVKIKNQKKIKRQRKIRAKVIGTSQRPRLNISRSLNGINVQVIDDSIGKTLVSANNKEIKDKKLSKTDQAAQVGKLIAQKATEKKITKVVFDRGGNQYHGRIKALADAAREGGLEF